MSRGFDWGADWPHKFRNETGAALPGFSIFNCSNSGTDNGDYLVAGLPNADGQDALFVTSPTERANESHGECRSIFDGPFWVRYEGDAPVTGNIVGPVSGTSYVSTAGAGLKVLDVRSGLVRCTALTNTSAFELFFVMERLSECGGPALCRRLIFLDPACSDEAAGPAVTNYVQADPETTEVCPWLGWRGVAFEGDVPVASDNGCTIADVILARRVGDKWFAVGSGHTSLFGLAGADIAADETGIAQAYHKHGLCDFYPAFNQCTGEDFNGYRSSTVTVRAHGGAIASGDAIDIHWSGTEWFAVKAANIECADDVCDRVDSLEDRMDTAEAAIVDADERLDDLEDRMDDAETRLDDIEDEIQNILDDIRDLFECCRQNQECCYYLDERLDYCCDAGLPNAAECGRCVWDWNAADEDPVLVQGCSGGGSCLCDQPDPVEFTVPGIYYTECHGDPDAGVCESDYPEPPPETLTATGCGLPAPVTLTLTGAGVWTGSTVDPWCGDTASVTVTWSGGTWSAIVSQGVVVCSIESVSCDISSIDPVNITFDMDGDCCQTGCELTVTE